MHLPARTNPPGDGRPAGLRGRPGSGSRGAIHRHHRAGGGRGPPWAGYHRQRSRQRLHHKPAHGAEARAQQRAHRLLPGRRALLRPAHAPGQRQHHPFGTHRRDIRRRSRWRARDLRLPGLRRQHLHRPGPDGLPASQRRRAATDDDPLTGGDANTRASPRDANAAASTIANAEAARK